MRMHKLHTHRLFSVEEEGFRGISSHALRAPSHRAPFGGLHL